MSSDGPEVGAQVDQAAYRKVIGRFATGVAIVTATHGDQRFAMTANSITSVSVEPLLVLASFMRDSDTGAAVRRSGRFGLSVLDVERGHELALRCAGKLPPGADDDQLSGVATRPGPDDVPLIEGALECLVCTVEQIHTIGDHDVVIGRGERVREVERTGEPLVFYDGDFWRLGEPRG